MVEPTHLKKYAQAKLEKLSPGQKLQKIWQLPPPFPNEHSPSHGIKVNRITFRNPEKIKGCQPISVHVLPETYSDPWCNYTTISYSDQSSDVFEKNIMASKP